MVCFNPCCRGSGIPGALPWFAGVGFFLFQSLLSWIRHSRSYIALKSVRDFSSFNPCCRGSGIPGKNVVPKSILSSSFNPCCRGSGIPGKNVVPKSILSSSFNPCCRGSGIPGYRQQLYRLNHQRFQSLLSWIRHSRTMTDVSTTVIDSLFQSLLSWIRHSRPFNDARHAVNYMMFQSLLSWIRHSRPSTIIGSSDISSFNPCCRGSGIPGILTDPAPGMVTSFNPCCRGSGIPGSMGLSLHPLYNKFQSLLSWIRHSRIK
ncbi:hypothetical protein HRM2_05610 [Desulforapulum autotrophicum HRM2]|uniref:Uncharacterized protein n=1 Tax=Desulforapulum autotrophicum (strain ATCC 43914 / DSM 3382 / VKM B-1955 / HRM2) TaxID=177437 RepID=C0QHW7_DESAH|nr:hypothetical protein HRM2_05610 [Desulforapulum autotrophicum HRM2]